MAEFDGSLFNDSLFDGYYAFGSGAAFSDSQAACGGTIVKASRPVALGTAILDGRAGRLILASGAGNGAAIAAGTAARVRFSSGAVTGSALGPCDGLRARNSSAAALGIAQASGSGLRLRTLPFPAAGLASASCGINKLVFPPLVQSLRVRRWSKPASALDLCTGAPWQ
ncbi:MAG TPA: hypothetical protein VN428_27080 [Bryobacteraceae bacterium]|nr:hypothetical protein [Bryobacteraceae bacterium]